MGKRSRARGRAEKLEAPTSDHTSPDGDVLTLRGAMTAKTRQEYLRAADPSQARAAASQEDAWHRAVEFLFERLAVRWEVSGVPTEGQRELLVRFRVATPAERAWVRDALRAHLADHFPELPAP